jgi:hypothetical protein
MGLQAMELPDEIYPKDMHEFAIFIADEFQMRLCRQEESSMTFLILT